MLILMEGMNEEMNIVFCDKFSVYSPLISLFIPLVSKLYVDRKG